MTFPAPPVNPNTSAPLAIPLWCTSGIKADPELTQDVISTGWQAVPGQNYGQIPPYQWVNWTSYQVGQFLNWIANPDPTYGALAYIKAGNFDGSITAVGNISSQQFVIANVGMHINSGGSLYLYSYDNPDNYVALSGNYATDPVIYFLPPNVPDENGQMLQSNRGGLMTWNYPQASLTQGNTTGTAPLAGFIGEVLNTYNPTVTPVTSDNWTLVASKNLTAGIWDVSGIVQVNGVGTTLTYLGAHIGPDTSSTTTAPASLIPGYNSGGIGGTSNTYIILSITIPVTRVSISTTTPYYLNAQLNYTGYVQLFAGNLTATRVA